MEKMKLSVIIPVYNEEETIEKVIKKVEAVRINKEIIIVNDGSTDRTGEILKKYEKKHKLIHKENEGKGSAVIRGLKESTGNIIIIQDADLEYDPSDYPKIINPIMKGESEVVYGTRIFANKGNLKKQKFTYASHYIGNKILTVLTNVLYGTKLTDMETGYKAFTKKALKGITLTAKGFELEPEITSKILKKGIKIKEMPIKYYSRSFKEGKKINYKDGIKAAYYLIRYKISD